MKTRKKWKVYRCTTQRDDGQRRWDETYQFLLQCMIQKEAREEEQEERNGSCTICPCLNHTATLDQTIEQQIERLREYVKEQLGWHLEEKHIYLDEGYSGAKLNRPGLERLREHAAKAEFEVILITAPDRLARNYVHQMLLIIWVVRFSFWSVP